MNLPGFEIACSKFGRTDLDFENLYEAHDIYGTAKAKELIERAPKFKNDSKKLMYLLDWRDKIDPRFSADDKRTAELLRNGFKKPA